MTPPTLPRCCGPRRVPLAVLDCAVSRLVGRWPRRPAQPLLRRSIASAMPFKTTSTCAETCGRCLRVRVQRCGCSRFCLPSECCSALRSARALCRSCWARPPGWGASSGRSCSTPQESPGRAASLSAPLGSGNALPTAWLAGITAAVAFKVVAPIGVRDRVLRLHVDAREDVRRSDGSAARRLVAAGTPVAGEIPAALDLLAACLSAGAAPTQAMAAVGRCFDGEVGDVLNTVASLSALGASPEVAWSSAIEVGGHGRWQPVARAVVRAHHSGAALTEVLVHLADDRRRWLRSNARAAAERAGVKAVLPLGLCFLPAFVLVGVVPVVAGFARTLWQ